MFVLDFNWEGCGIFIAENIEQAYAIYLGNRDKFYFDVLDFEKFTEKCKEHVLVLGLCLEVGGDY